ncbi:hypothetical protein DIPPA_50013, partial [Diplonema papillatum]
MQVALAAAAVAALLMETGAAETQIANREDSRAEPAASTTEQNFGQAQFGRPELIEEDPAEVEGKRERMLALQKALGGGGRTLQKGSGSASDANAKGSDSRSDAQTDSSRPANSGIEERLRALFSSRLAQSTEGTKESQRLKTTPSANAQTEALSNNASPSSQSGSKPAASQSVENGEQDRRFAPRSAVRKADDPLHEPELNGASPSRSGGKAGQSQSSTADLNERMQALHNAPSSHSGEKVSHTESSTADV